MLATNEHDRVSILTQPFTEKAMHPACSFPQRQSLPDDDDVLEKKV